MSNAMSNATGKPISTTMIPFRIAYFGKLPARCDFVKGGEHFELTGLIDEWLAGMMNQLTANPRWKQHYDSVPPLHFAFVGPCSGVAVAGHLAASCDQAGRRFPFIAAGTLDVLRPQSFLAVSPLVLAPLWQRLGSLADDVLAAAEPAAPLQALNKAVLQADCDSAAHAAALGSFAATTDLAALETMLASGKRHYPARQLLLGIGLLLQPFSWTGKPRLDRSFVLPLPRAPECQAPVAAYWLALITPFLLRLDIELALFVAELKQQPVLVVGFAGASPGALQAIIDPEAADGQLIAFDEAAWVDNMIAGDPAVSHLSACLAQGSLSMAAALDLFRETFA